MCVSASGASGLMWHVMNPYDWLNKFYSFCMAAIASFVSRHGLSINVRCRDQPNCYCFKTIVYKYVTRWITLLIDHMQLRAYLIRNWAPHAINSHMHLAVAILSGKKK